MITQKAMVSGVSGAFTMISQAGFAINNDDSVLSYLTLAHIFGRIIEELALAAGAHIGYWRVRCIALETCPVLHTAHNKCPISPFFSFSPSLSLSLPSFCLVPSLRSPLSSPPPSYFLSLCRATSSC